MSYDLQVWTALKPDLDTLLRADGDWRCARETYCLEGKGWQVLVTAAQAVEAEDVPAEVVGSVPGIRFLTQVTIEPINAPKSALGFGRKAALRIAKAAHGVVHDAQDGSVLAGQGVKRFAPVARPKRFSGIELSWWFIDGPLATSEGLERFVDLLSAQLPEALPRRYGLYEPPPHRLSDEGLPHFKKFLEAHRSETVVWYPSRPVVGVGLYLESHAPPQLGFRCRKVDLTIEASALDQPGWRAGLEAFWRRASILLRPFYGDVRTLGGLIRGRATYSADIDTEFGPTRGPFWRGIPRSPGHACVLGPEYAEAWPAFRERSRVANGLAFLSAERWDGASSVLDIVGPVPDSIAQLRMPTWSRHHSGGQAVNWNTEYPQVWPLGPRPPSDPEW